MYWKNDTNKQINLPGGCVPNICQKYMNYEGNCNKHYGYLAGFEIVKAHINTWIILLTSYCDSEVKENQFWNVYFMICYNHNSTDQVLCFPPNVVITNADVIIKAKVAFGLCFCSFLSIMCHNTMGLRCLKSLFVISAVSIN